MMKNLPAEVSRIAAHLDIPLDADTGEQIAADHSMTRQRKRIEASKCDENSLRDGFVPRGET